MTCFSLIFVCWPADLAEQLRSCSQYNVNTVTYTKWMTCTCCLCPTGTRAISQSPPSKALRMFCQSRLLFSSPAQVCLARTVTWPLLRPITPPPPLMWIKLPLWGCHGLLDWLPSHLMLHSTARPSETLKTFTWFVFLGSFKRFQFSSRTPVWKKELACYSVIVALWLRGFLFGAPHLSEQLPVCRILRNSLERLHVHLKIHT